MKYSKLVNSPDVMTKIVKKMGLRVVEDAGLLPADAEAYHFEEDKTIIIDPSLSQPRKNFLMAYGLAHHIFSDEIDIKQSDRSAIHCFSIGILTGAYGENMVKGIDDRVDSGEMDEGGFSWVDNSGNLQINESKAGTPQQRLDAEIFEELIDPNSDVSGKRLSELSDGILSEMSDAISEASVKSVLSKDKNRTPEELNEIKKMILENGQIMHEVDSLKEVLQKLGFGESDIEKFIKIVGE
ncbi:MAG: ImmA/IrrE family metallo-endopeptidase [Candidatus Marinimicrobia bacterium]|nr:ImmA/IrrE family metallo-endopeptidase [Candidatus Neomarinimicrobiota bacterium]